MCVAADRPAFPRGDKVGILAGWGRFPLVVAQALRRQGRRTYCLGVTGHAEAGLAAACDRFAWVGLARLGAAVRFFRHHGVREITMAGKIHKTVLFRPYGWFRLLPDWFTIRTFIPHLITRRKDCKDDSLLTTVCEAFAREGIHFGPATDHAPELLVRPGRLTRRRPTTWQEKDIHFGWRIAKQMGHLDVGQSVVVKDQAVLAVEAVEGTDACIRRGGELCRAGGFTVVKVAKPRQDMRFDVPTVGLQTLENLVGAGGRVLAIEAGRTILLDEPEVIDFADRHHLVIVALEEPSPQPST